MATFSGGMNLKLDKYNKSFLDSIIAKEVRKVEQLGKETLKEMRENIVDEWFGGYNSYTMNQYTMYESKVHQSGDKVVVTISSYIDSSGYENDHDRSADSWKSKYGGELGTGDYILGLQLDQGIIGLPEDGTFHKLSNGTYWHNDNFIQKENLQDVLNRELSKNWNKKIKENYNNRFK